MMLHWLVIRALRRWGELCFPSLQKPAGSIRSRIKLKFRFDKWKGAGASGWYWIASEWYQVSGIQWMVSNGCQRIPDWTLFYLLSECRRPLKSRFHSPSFAFICLHSRTSQMGSCWTRKASAPLSMERPDYHGVLLIESGVLKLKKVIASRL